MTSSSTFTKSTLSIHLRNECKITRKLSTVGPRWTPPVHTGNSSVRRTRVLRWSCRYIYLRTLCRACRTWSVRRVWQENVRSSTSTLTSVFSSDQILSTPVTPRISPISYAWSADTRTVGDVRGLCSIGWRNHITPRGVALEIILIRTDRKWIIHLCIRGDLSSLLVACRTFANLCTRNLSKKLHIRLVSCCWLPSTLRWRWEQWDLQLWMCHSRSDREVSLNDHWLSLSSFKM